MAVFFLFSTKNLSSVVKMMMTVSKQRAGGGVPDMDDKQSLIDDIETGDWCLSLICCINVVLYDYFYATFSLLHPPPPKKERARLLRYSPIYLFDLYSAKFD